MTKKNAHHKRLSNIVERSLEQIEGMKRVGHIYDNICSYENLSLALDRASQFKKNKYFVKRILDDREYYIILLQTMLSNETYRFNKNIYKTVRERSSQKERSLTVPKFYPDQVIHWAVCLQLQEVFMKGMYRYNCGSVPGRGGIYGKEYIDKIYKRDKEVKYILKLDIKKFFPSVSNDKLKQLLRTKIKDFRVLKLLDMIIDNGGEGLPIGYYTSQWFSNFYLEKLDHYIKEVLKIRHYIRYVDDMVLIDTSKQKLHQARAQITARLEMNEYKLILKSNWQLWKIHSRPLDFLGFKFYNHKTFLRKRIFISLNRRVCKISKKGYCTVRAARGLTSLLGWLKQVPSGQNYYIKNIKPVISKYEISKIISSYDKNQRR